MRTISYVLYLLGALAFVGSGLQELLLGETARATINAGVAFVFVLCAMAVSADERRHAQSTSPPSSLG